MCGCGTVEWCDGTCVCGCDHDMPDGMARQGKHFAAQAAWKEDLWREARAERDEWTNAVGADRDLFVQAHERAITSLVEARAEIARLREELTAERSSLAWSNDRAAIAKVRALAMPFRNVCGASDVGDLARTVLAALDTFDTEA